MGDCNCQFHQPDLDSDTKDGLIRCAHCDEQLLPCRNCKGWVSTKVGCIPALLLGSGYREKGRE